MTIQIENVNDEFPEYIDLDSAMVELSKYSMTMSTNEIYEKYSVVDEETNNASFYQIKGEDTEFPDTMDDLELELLSPDPDSGPFYFTKLSPGVWDVGVRGCKHI